MHDMVNAVISFVLNWALPGAVFVGVGSILVRTFLARLRELNDTLK